MRRKIATRRVDELGRLVVPVEARDALDIAGCAPVDILLDGDEIILRRNVPCCTICGASDMELVQVKGRWVCADCVAQIRK